MFGLEYCSRKRIVAVLCEALLTALFEKLRRSPSSHANAEAHDGWCPVVHAMDEAVPGPHRTKKVYGHRTKNLLRDSARERAHRSTVSSVLPPKRLDRMSQGRCHESRSGNWAMVRSLVETVTSLLQRQDSLEESPPTESEESDGPSDTEPEPPSVDVETLPDLLSSDERDVVKGGVNQLVGLPTLSSDRADPLVQILLSKTRADDPTMRRVAYRGLRELVRLEPSVVRTVAPILPSGLTAYRIAVRRECARTAQTVLVESPRYAPLFYSSFDAGDDTVSELSFEILLEAGTEHPVVLAPLSCYFLEQVQNPEPLDPAIVSAIERLRSWDPELIDEAGPLLLDRLPTVNTELHEAVLSCLEGWIPAVEGDAQSVARTFLNEIPHANPTTGRQYAGYIAALADQHAAVDSTIGEWGTRSDSRDWRIFLVRCEECDEIEPAVRRRFIAGADTDPRSTFR